MTLRNKIENNLTLTILGTLLAGFLAGISCYQFILKAAQLKVVSASPSKLNITTESYQVLPPTWIDLPGAIPILDGQGLLSATEVCSWAIDTETETRIPMALNLCIEMQNAKWNEGEKAVKAYPGSRYVYSDENTKYAVDLLALETDRVKISISKLAK